MYFIGYDIGSSSVKAALVEVESGKSVALTKEPENEMEITALQPGWAEQDPDSWWKHLCAATKKLLQQQQLNSSHIQGIGIAYQMHGLVVIDKDGQPLRKSIIWCDGRAVATGDKAFLDLGADKCGAHLLNAPGNFTASKLKWVQENEPEIYGNIHKFMLPGDYIALKLSGIASTTVMGLSEGIFWDYKTNTTASWLLDYLNITPELVPEIADNFTDQGRVNEKAAAETGLSVGTPIFYRAGDQPNNALSLNVLQPGEIAATAGTSGVIYAVTDTLAIEEINKVNNFTHVNHRKDHTRIGQLLCINGCGILYRWLRQNLAVSSYAEMDQQSASIEAGSQGLRILPFGNGPERLLDNKAPGARISGLNFNIHGNAHLCKAALEGIAFSFAYGSQYLSEKGRVIRTGDDNLFRSELFSEMVASLLDVKIELYNTTGAVGAARACGMSGKGSIDMGDQLYEQDYIKTYSPGKEYSALKMAYSDWKLELQKLIK